jgi:hypothetical protein
MPYSRRSFLAAVAAVTAQVGTPVYAQPSSSAAPYADSAAADEWLQRWMRSLGSVSGALHLGRFADRMYYLTKEIEWTPDPGQNAHPVRVPVGFVTDFASIPRAFWSLLPPDGLYTYPAIIHDYLYWEQPVSRAEADLVLRYGMEDFKVDGIVINAIYAGVRTGGGVPWGDNASLKAAGERRILKIYPTDPTARWDEYKRKPGVV